MEADKFGSGFFYGVGVGQDQKDSSKQILHDRAGRADTSGPGLLPGRRTTGARRFGSSMWRT